MNTFLSTLPARGATTWVSGNAVVSGISIHAPREGSDQRSRLGRHNLRISIHAPREGSDFFTTSISSKVD